MERGLSVITLQGAKEKMNDWMAFAQQKKG